MKILLKILNPFIFLINWFMYESHLQNNRIMDDYEPYDFSKDINYF